MQRYFLEVAYKGNAYSGFQVQENANTIQAEVEKALQTYYRTAFSLTGSSRTDAGVHAISNYFHFDGPPELVKGQRDLYHLNAILPSDIALKRLLRVTADAHCRFDAVSRTYEYHIYRDKDPFKNDRAFFYPYPLDMELLNCLSGLLIQYSDFTSFSKKNTQVKTFICKILECRWTQNRQGIIFRIRGDRFLRGMVRGIVGSMLRAGSGKISEEEFINIIESRDSNKADFSVAAQGLYLIEVSYPGSIFLD